MGVLLALGIAASVICLAVCTAWLVLTGNWRWNDEIRRTAWRLWGNGMGLAVATGMFIWGRLAVIAAWPVWGIFAWTAALGFGIMDALFGVGWFKRGKIERTVTHADGTRAIVDGRGKGYRRV